MKGKWKVRKFGDGGLVTRTQLSSFRNKPIVINADSVLQANKKIPFVNKIISGDTTSIQVPGLKGRSTHLLSQADNIVFPQVQTINGKLIYVPDWKDAYTNAKKTGNYIPFKSEQEALNFSEQYKNTPTWNSYINPVSKSDTTIPKYQWKPKTIVQDQTSSQVPVKFKYIPKSLDEIRSIEKKSAIATAQAEEKYKQSAYNAYAKNKSLVDTRPEVMANNSVYANTYKNVKEADEYKKQFSDKDFIQQAVDLGLTFAPLMKVPGIGYGLVDNAIDDINIGESISKTPKARLWGSENKKIGGGRINLSPSDLENVEPQVAKWEMNTISEQADITPNKRILNDPKNKMLFDEHIKWIEDNSIDETGKIAIADWTKDYYQREILMPKLKPYLNELRKQGLLIYPDSYNSIQKNLAETTKQMADENLIGGFKAVLNKPISEYKTSSSIFDYPILNSITPLTIGTGLTIGNKFKKKSQ